MSIKDERRPPQKVAVQGQSATLPLLGYDRKPGQFLVSLERDIDATHYHQASGDRHPNLK
jgi:hypothetical protein